MVKTKILISVIIVIVIGVAAAGYQVSNTPGLWTPTTTQEQQSVSQNNPSVQSQSGSTVNTGSGSSQSSSNGGSSVKISPSQAKSIAQKSIAEQGATTGTPKIITIKGKKTYVVPVITNGKTSGEIWIDAQTGENVGGAGGAPNG